MWRFVKNHILELYTIVMVILAVVLFVNWPVIAYTRRILAIFMILTALHEWEETRFPGGFYELMLSKLGNREELDIDFGLCHFIVVVLFLVCVIPGTVFPHLVWLAMMPVTLGIVEALMHLAGIALFHRPRPYTPGLVTALLMLAASIYALVTGFGSHAVGAWDLVIGIVLMILGFLAMQQAMLRTAGLNPREFLASMTGRNRS